jgi:hypothetical protein
MKVQENYIMSVCDELDGYHRELYEAMMDDETSDIMMAISNMRRTLSDIQKSYKDDEERN